MSGIRHRQPPRLCRPPAVGHTEPERYLPFPLTRLHYERSTAERFRVGLPGGVHRGPRQEAAQIALYHTLGALPSRTGIHPQILLRVFSFQAASRARWSEQAGVRLGERHRLHSRHDSTSLPMSLPAACPEGTERQIASKSLIGSSRSPRGVFHRLPDHRSTLTVYHLLPAGASLWLLLLKIDQKLALVARQRGCSRGGRLHRAGFPRKPRGQPEPLPDEYRRRFSFCH